MSAVGEQVAEWMQDQCDRALARQRATADNAKLVATFIAAIAATLVATALQVGDMPGRLDIAASVVLVAAVGLTAMVVRADKICEADHQAILSASVSSGTRWPDAQLLAAFRSATVAAADGNEKVVERIGVWLIAQVMTSGIAGTLSIISLLLPAAGTSR